MLSANAAHRFKGAPSAFLESHHQRGEYHLEERHLLRRVGNLMLPVLLPSAAQDTYVRQALTDITKYFMYCCGT